MRCGRSFFFFCEWNGDWTYSVFHGVYTCVEKIRMGINNLTMQDESDPFRLEQNYMKYVNEIYDSHRHQNEIKCNNYISCFVKLVIHIYIFSTYAAMNRVYCVCVNCSSSKIFPALYNITITSWKRYETFSYYLLGYTIQLNIYFPLKHSNLSIIVCTIIHKSWKHTSSYMIFICLHCRTKFITFSLNLASLFYKIIIVAFCQNHNLLMRSFSLFRVHPFVNVSD